MTFTMGMRLKIFEELKKEAQVDTDLTVVLHNILESVTLILKVSYPKSLALQFITVDEKGKLVDALEQGVLEYFPCSTFLQSNISEHRGQELRTKP